MYIKFTPDCSKCIAFECLSKSKRLDFLRHTYATKLFERNTKLKTVSELLGHSNIAITADIYTHVMPKGKNDAAESINDLFD
ncbi:tyrosine-type recombinase/integrase [Clostridium estertheticum]|uniref:tyrosine-type recombinase/integrase n=1 Tax=Clostridium estertheticum TaxID=238834 RepID=UPI001C0B5B7E|nr:tyrosine-type recombinase/integrase [Clostridium estertheticum]MBU3213815.1 tyrosine-type recombinase/integrase [Clostridium estertheticum]